MTNPRQHRPGDVLRLTRSASVQFSEPILFRLIRIHDWDTYDGWAWLDGYQLDGSGDAIERRSVFVQILGVQVVPPPPPPPPPPRRRAPVSRR